MSALTLLMALPLMLAPAQEAEPVNLRLGPEGEILAWLVAGPFPNVGALELKGTGFRTDYLNPESSATAVEGQIIPAIPFEKQQDRALIKPRRKGWRLGIADPKTGLDLDRLLNGSTPGIAYCYAELVSPSDQTAKLLFGSDDGAKVWINGKQIFEKQVARGVKRDEDQVPLRLHVGTNHLLFKIEQGNGGWGLLARVVGQGLREQIAIEAEHGPRKPHDESPGEDWIRHSAGKRGSLDLAEAILLDQWMPKAERWANRYELQTTKEHLIHEAVGRARKINRDESDLDRLSADLASARKSVQRAYYTARQPFVDRMQAPGPQFQTTVAKEDYVRPMPTGRYFVDSKGKAFIPIGYNHNPDWPKFIEANGEEEVYKPALPDQYMAHLRQNGVNVIRLMIETPQSGNLEQPLGVFRPEHVVWIDTIVAAARKHGIKLIITPWDTFWMNLRWDATAYNPENGGLVQKRIEFITSPAVRKQQKRRLQYMIDRWGNTGTIFSWEILNEGDLWWGANAQQLEAWATDITTFVRTHEKGRWGRNHMVSFSFAEPMPKGDMAKFAFTSKLFDYATTHLYIGATRAPTEAIGPAFGIQQGVNYALAQIKDNRPFMDTENGPIDRWVADEKLDDEVFHSMSWAHLASGAAGSGFRWPYRNPHHLTEGMLATLKVMSQFSKEVDWKALSGKQLPLKIVGEKGAAVCGFGTAPSALVWTSGSEQLELSWGGARTARAQLFDTRSGQKTTRAITADKGRFILKLPRDRSFAIVLSLK
jgi:mannan endo-1,4-beta-mannosidase